MLASVPIVFLLAHNPTKLHCGEHFRHSEHICFPAERPGVLLPGVD
jgi:hypothetical protein